MRTLHTLFLAIIALPFIAHSQIQPDRITIVRDSFGVPHIYAPTDAEATYGLAWAYCEDDFETLQIPFLAIKGLYSSVKGKDGVLLDAVAFFVGADRVVEEKYETSFTPKFKQLIRAYVQALNDYAESHPKEVRHKKLFPLEEKDIVKGYVMSFTFFANVHYDLIRIFDGTIKAQEDDLFSRGSNGWAFAPYATADGHTYVVSNTHQPLQGMSSWYECQIQTDEGWHFHGATFAGGITPFLGANPDLGWTHTTNYDDYNDVYRLVMHPQNKLQYRYDGEWKTLEVRKLKLKVKIGGVKVPVTRKFYWSEYGPTLKNKDGFYALRFPANMVLGAPEQWYRMNKARSYAEFKAALDLQTIPNQNVIYGDRAGNIFFLGNGLFPKRNPAYTWDRVLPGDTSATKWAPEWYPIEDIPFIKNPDCGYVFNMNHTSLNCTCPEENPQASDFSPTLGLQPKNTARALRFRELFSPDQPITYEQLKVIKYDSQFPDPLYTRTIENLNSIRTLSAEKYPDIADALAILSRWDGKTDVDNQQAALASLSIQYFLKHLRKEGIPDYNNTFEEIVFADAIRFAKKHLLKHFGALEIPLGDLQKHVRGDVELGVWGVPEVITQMTTVPHKNGTYKSRSGESYILFMRFVPGETFPRLESVVPYGSSNHEDSPHYTDQMELYINKQLKPITMDRAEILKKAERSYHPGE